jgi:hypothetical protein
MPRKKILTQEQTCDLIEKMFNVKHDTTEHREKVIVKVFEENIGIDIEKTLNRLKRMCDWADEILLYELKNPPSVIRKGYGKMKKL